MLKTHDLDSLISCVIYVLYVFLDLWCSFLCQDTIVLSVFSTLHVLCVVHMHVCVPMYALACGGQRLVLGVLLDQPLPYFSKQGLNQLIDPARLAGHWVPRIHHLCLPRARIPDVQYHVWRLHRCWGPTLMEGTPRSAPFPQSRCFQGFLYTLIWIWKLGAVFVLCQLLS